MRVERATLSRFSAWLSEERGLEFDDYPELWRWSVDDLEGFWAAIVEFFEVRFTEPASAVLGSASMRVIQAPTPSG